MHEDRAFIGLGANLGDAPRTLAAAVRAMADLPGVSLAGVSRLYVTRPVEVEDQPDFHNAVAALDVPAGWGLATDADTTRESAARGSAVALLLALKAIERAFGRQERFRYGPRELDLDVLLFGEERLVAARPEAGRSLDPAKRPRLLEVPHPQARNRLFVLAPLADLAPDLVPPGWDESVASARDRRVRVEGESAVRPVARWDAAAKTWVAED
jgi:2-amino-4-hydroxy-6-hydroxymethyldihydropteridine diphosphokinase